MNRNPGNRNMGFGIIGCGVIAAWHAEAIRQCAGIRLAGAWDIRAEAAQDFCCHYAIQQYETLEALLQDPHIQAVCVCTPSGRHAAMAMRAVESGKHVLLEKPMALSMEEAEALITAADERNVKLGVVSQWRFAPTTGLLKEAVENGRFGKILIADLAMNYCRTAEYYVSKPWRGTYAMDGGILMNQGIHGIDILQYIVGPVRQVFGIARRLHHDIEVPDSVSAILEFACGAVGVVQATTAACPGSPRVMRLYGTKGTMTLTEDAITSWMTGEDRDAVCEKPAIATCRPVAADRDDESSHITCRSEAGQDTEKMPVSGLQAVCPRENDSETVSSAQDPQILPVWGHVRQIADMASAIWEDRRPMIDGREGIKPLRIIAAIYESASRQSPVCLPVDFL